MPQDIPTGGYPGGSIPTGGFGGEITEITVTKIITLNFMSSIIGVPGGSNPSSRAITLESEVLE